MLAEASIPLSPVAYSSIFQFAAQRFWTIFLLTIEVARLPYEYARLP
jgi:hypothetical protein